MQRERKITVRLTDAEYDRLMLWWLYRPVPPGPAKETDLRLIGKFRRARSKKGGLRV